ncbi:MAG: hypothetical protein FE834_09620, partial [Gammaproteobacteria bacterium]|nr:hypothetical protein [Gammaproteobacteria bacterium]
LSADVDLNLYDGDGNLLHEGWDWGNVDITYTKTLSTGVYFVEVDYYNGHNSGITSTYDLSLTSSNTTTLVPTPDTDNSISKAQDIGALTTGTKVLQDSITKTTDDKDFYKFELIANSKVDFLLSKLSADVDLNLYDSSGHLIHGGWDWGNVDIAYTKTLTAGTYYAEVDYYSSSNQGTTSTYDLTLTLVPAPDTDNTIATAQNIGVLVTGTKVLQDSITKTTDDKDFYKFELTTNGQVDFSLSKLSANVDLNLYDSDGSSIHQGWVWNDSNITYAKALLAGTYFVEVKFDDDFNQKITSTFYDLSLTLSDVPADTDNTIATAQNIGALMMGTKVLKDSITEMVDDKDFYKFELTANGKVDFSLSKLSADVDLNLYDSAGSLIHQSWALDGSDVAYTKILVAGIYFVGVDYKDYNDGFNQKTSGTPYDLSLTLSHVPDTDNTIATAQNIGVLVTGTKVLQDSVTKTTDDKDFYKFELTTNG